MTRSPVAREVARLAGPAIAQSLLSTLLFLVDRAMLGRHSAEALASMQISGPLTWSLSSLVGAVQIGAIAVIGRSVGSEDRAASAAAVRGGLVASVGLGTVVGTLAWASLPLLLQAFPEAGEAVRDEAHGYLSWMLPAIPLLIVATMAAAVHQAAGDTRTPLLVAVIANVVNAALNAVLIFGLFGVPSLGARGAAIGSVIALAVECVVLLALLSRRGARVTMRGRGGERAQLGRMLTVAGPALAERAAQHAGYLAYVGMIGALGPLAMAANQALIGIESIAFLSADGFGIAGAAVVAQRLGARQPDEAKDAAKAATGMSIAALTAIGLAFVIAPHAIAATFTDDAEIVAEVVPCLMVAAASQPFMATAVVLGASLRGAGATRVTLAITLVGGLVVRLVATWAFGFALELGLIGVWLGSTLDWVVRTALFVIVFRRGAWAGVKV